MGISIQDMDYLTVGIITDMFIEKLNDQSEDEPKTVIAGQHEFDVFAGRG